MSTDQWNELGGRPESPAACTAAFGQNGFGFAK